MTAGTVLHRCQGDIMRRWLPVYIRIKHNTPAPQDWRITGQVKRRFVRVGWMCSVCGVEITDANTVSRAQSLEKPVTTPP